jgi:hypothetical protein
MIANNNWKTLTTMLVSQGHGKVQEVTQNQVGRKQNDDRKEKKTRNPKTPREEGDYKEKQVV